MAFSNSHEINKLTIDIYPQFTRNVYWDVDSRRKYYSDDYRVEAHEDFFNWRREDEESMQRMLAWATKRIFAQSERVQKETDKYYWVNNKPIILTGITSRQRIIFLRDITDRLRDECYSSKAFVVHFKLGNTEFSLELNPTKNQPGNGILWMGENSHPHWLIENEFECFRLLYARDIDRIIRDARVKGLEITENHISRIQPELTNYEPYNRSKKQIIEELNFVMLLYDFEVARRLQRPMTDDSQHLDILPIGIGIAILHRIQKMGNGFEDSWQFYSDIFKGSAIERGNALEGIIFQFQQKYYPFKSLSKNILIEELYSQFG